MRRENDNQWKENRDSLSKDWTKYLSNNFHNYIFIPIPNCPNNSIKLANNLNLDGILLSNGNDWGSCLDRDNTEINLIEWCRNQNKPIFGVCRGFQVLNKYFGGQIKKNLKIFTNYRHAGGKHKINIVDKKVLGRNIKGDLLVNSFHNEGVLEEDLAKDLIPFAKVENLIEGFYHNDESIIGIQWHPERNNTEKQFDIDLIKMLFDEKLH